MKFSTKLYLPAIDKTVRVSEIEYGDFITLQKYLIGNDDTDIERYFNYLIDKYVDYKGYLPAIDKFIILLFQRACSFHPDFEVTHEGATYKTNLNDLINNLIKFEERVKFPLQRISTDKVDYYINLPSKFSYKMKVDFIYDWIYSISFRDSKTILERKDINLDILKATPANISKQLEMIIEIITDAFANIPLPVINVIAPPGSDPIKLDLSNGILIEILKLMLKSNLLEWYQKNHFLSSKGGYLLSDLFKLPPAEVNTYYKMLEEEAQEIAKASNKQEQS